MKYLSNTCDTAVNKGKMCENHCFVTLQVPEIPFWLQFPVNVRVCEMNEPVTVKPLSLELT